VTFLQVFVMNLPDTHEDVTVVLDDEDEDEDELSEPPVVITV